MSKYIYLKESDEICGPVNKSFKEHCECLICRKHLASLPRYKVTGTHSWSDLQVLEENVDFRRQWDCKLGAAKCKCSARLYEGCSNLFFVAIPIKSDSKVIDGKDELTTAMQLKIGRLEVNCFDEDSEMSIRVGNSRYQSLSIDEAKELEHFIHSHIIHETEANPPEL